MHCFPGLAAAADGTLRPGSGQPPGYWPAHPGKDAQPGFFRGYCTVTVTFVEALISALVESDPVTVKV